MAAPAGDCGRLHGGWPGLLERPRSGWAAGHPPWRPTSCPVRAALPAVLSTHEHPRGAAWLSMGSPLGSQLCADSPGRGRLGGVRQKFSPGSGRRLQAAPSLLGTGPLETPWPESVDCPPAVVGGHSPFHVRHCAVHSKPACNPLANFLSHPRGWLGVTETSRCGWKEGWMPPAPLPHPRLPSGAWWLGEGEGPLCARIPQGRLPPLGPVPGGYPPTPGDQRLDLLGLTMTSRFPPQLVSRGFRPLLGSGGGWGLSFIWSNTAAPLQSSGLQHR